MTIRWRGESLSFAHATLCFFGCLFLVLSVVAIFQFAHESGNGIVLAPLFFSGLCFLLVLEHRRNRNEYASTSRVSPAKAERVVIVVLLISIASVSYWYLFVHRYVIGISEGTYTLGRNFIEIGSTRDDIRRNLGIPSDTQISRHKADINIEEWSYRHWDGSQFVLVFYESGDTVIRILHFKNMLTPSRWALRTRSADSSHAVATANWASSWATGGVRLTDRFPRPRPLRGAPGNLQIAMPIARVV